MDRLSTDIIDQIVGLLDVRAAFEFAQLIENDYKYQEVFQIIKNDGGLITITNIEQGVLFLGIDISDNCSREVYSLDTVIQLLEFFNEYSIQLYLELMEPNHRYNLLKIFVNYRHKINQIKSVFEYLDADDLLLFDSIGDKIDYLGVNDQDPTINTIQLIGEFKNLRHLYINLKDYQLIDLSNTKLTGGLLDEAQIRSLPLSLSAISLNNCDLTYYIGPIAAFQSIELINCTSCDGFVAQLLTTAKNSLTNFALLQDDIHANLNLSNFNALLSCPNIDTINFPHIDEPNLNFSIIPRQSPILKVIFTKIYTISNSFKLLDNFVNLQTLSIDILTVKGKPSNIHFPPNLKCLVISSISFETRKTKLDWKYMQLPTELEALTLMESGLKDIPKNLPKTLTYLNLSCNNIEKVPDFSDYKDLKHLRLSVNKIKKLIIKAPNLTDIAYDANPIQKIDLPLYTEEVSSYELNDSERYPTIYFGMLETHRL